MTRRRTAGSSEERLHTVAAQIATLGESVSALRRQMADHGLDSTREVPERGESVEQGDGPAPVIAVETAHKIWSRSLETVRVSRIGDMRFPTARKTWERLRRDFPVSPAVERRLIGLAFEGATQLVFEEIAAENLDASAEALWGLLAKRLYNASQQRSQRAKFLTTAWRERKESVEAYATRLRAAALSLPERISEEMLAQRFIEGLLLRVRSQALAVQGSFDEIVGRVALIAEPAGASVERVRSVREPLTSALNSRKSSPGKKERADLTPGGCWRERVCYGCRRPVNIASFCNEGRGKISVGNTKRAPRAGSGGAPADY